MQVVPAPESLHPPKDKHSQQWGPHSHRTRGAGKDLWKSIESNSLLKQAPYSRLHKKVPRWVLNISRGDSPTSLGSLLHCSVTLTVKKFFLTFVWNFLCLSFCPLHSVFWREVFILQNWLTSFLFWATKNKSALWEAFNMKRVVKRHRKWCYG